MCIIFFSEGVPLALCQFQGILLAGIGSVLRLYDLGKKRLLRKCENKLFPTPLSLLTPIVIRFMWGTFKKCVFLKYLLICVEQYDFALEHLTISSFRAGNS